MPAAIAPVRIQFPVNGTVHKRSRPAWPPIDQIGIAPATQACAATRQYTRSGSGPMPVTSIDNYIASIILKIALIVGSMPRQHSKKRRSINASHLFDPAADHLAFAI
ncbi:hypothetical protein [Burkholderia sp. MSMB1072]|uniref:hypothetical protein n=1 Tax=Burkholderia sp. MSMB1072 TaxID=1637871 RepID=UPI0015D03D08|nr:hypothetical protein [Burkholderia sp. MSMB1072]